MARLDQDTINMLKDVMEDEFVALLDTFFEDSVGRIEELEAALAGQDPEAFRRAAHSFKGSAGNLAAQDLAGLCLKAENMGQGKDLTAATELIAEIRTEYDALVPLLNQHR
ncbi:Hpt domain-containing protein [Simiduia agarivorans]|uniref:HPt domain-containing protein n=1 Tax=Simiduia agarivorans (strain DSM 21679 / JCM 13881 / BCRC 17597 / SA1) TaxID=1117647 RepID=K4KUV5_SIMAS|nr:Hpt domain-containing protein [Simiduia agarivorans]AFU97692.1 hypothetical protein M5M_02365 [Simiduia agarivorans SA1 = DSM 21679]